MDSNNWRAGQAQSQPPIQGGEAADGTGAAVMDTPDWRSQLPPESRQRIVSKIMETVKRQLPLSGPDGLQELRRISEKFEGKIFAAASSQQDYLRKISSKMLTMENKSQNPTANSLETNATSGSKNPTNSASGSLQPQVHNQGQPLPIPTMANQSQARQQLLSQNVQNTMTSAMPTGGTTITNVVDQNANLQNMQNIPTVAQNSMANSIGQGMPSNSFANTQRQMQGRQQQVVAQQQQQQSQNPQHYLYQQKLQNQLMSQKLQQGNVPQSLVQSHIQQQPQQQQQKQPQQQQQNLSQPSQHAMMQPSVMQNQQSPAQQSTQSMQQQHSQPLRQQQQPRQVPNIHQQQTSMAQQPKLATQQQLETQQQQQQQIIGQQQFISKPNSISEMQQQQSHQQRIGGQQSNMSNVPQQQQLIGQQSNLNMHQQQLGPQGNVAGLQQHKVMGAQSSNPGMLTNQQNVHLLQQSKVPGQQQIQQAATTLLPAQGQQSHPLVQLPQQQLISQIQSQPAQVQQQMGCLQQQENALQRDMQQRMQTSSPSLHQNVVDQRPMSEVPSTSLDSTAETGSVHGGDWQEEAYQKIRSMKETYFVDLSELYRKVAAKLQQHDSLPQQPKNQQTEKFKYFKGMLEKALQFLCLKKNEIQIAHREKIGGWEKQIPSILNSNRPRRVVTSFQQGQLPQPHMHALQHSQQPQSPIPQMQRLENHTDAQMQSMNAQSPVTTMQQNNMANLQHNSLSSASKRNMINALHSGSSLDSPQGNAQNSLKHVALGSLQQNLVSGTQQMNVSQLASQSGVDTLQSNLNHLRPNSNVIQNPHVTQQEQLQNQQLKQQYQRQMQQQILQRQQLIPQQQQQLKQQQQPGQLPAHQMSQIHQMGVKPGILQQNHSAGQRLAYHHQQLKSGTAFPISSSQVLRAASPQAPQHLSQQIDQHNLLTSFTKSGTPLQSSSSQLIAPSPSTPLAPSPMPVESEKVNPGVSSPSSAGNIGRQQAAVASAPSQSLAIGTPGISASPLLAEFTSPDGTHAVASTLVSGKSSTIEQPHERLMKAVNSMSSKALSASVSDISSIVNLVDRIAGSAPGNGSRDAVGEDLVAMTKCRLQARDFFMPNGSLVSKRCYSSAMPFNVVSSAGSVNDSFRQLNGSESSDLESTASSRSKRPKIKANHALLEEIRQINQRLIDTVVDISNEDVDPMTVAGAAECGEGTIVKCSFSGVALSPKLKSQYTSAQISPIQPLRLLVPNSYPNCSPVLLDKFPLEVSKEDEDLSIKAKSRFSNSLRTLSQPLSLAEIARTWDICAQAVISEYAQQNGGGSFSSKYGTWENCLRAA